MKLTWLAAIAWFASTPAHALFIGFDPAASVVSAGDSVGVNLMVGGLSAAGQTVTGFDLTIDYDASILAPTLVSFGPTSVLAADADSVLGDTFDLGFSFLGLSGLGSSGPLNLAALPLSPGAQDSVLLATIVFQALAPGGSELLLTAANVAGADGAPMAFDEIGHGMISVSPVNVPPVSVPEPGSVGLLACGLVLLWGLRRRSSANEPVTQEREGASAESAVTAEPRIGL